MPVYEKQKGYKIIQQNFQEIGIDSSLEFVQKLEKGKKYFFASFGENIGELEMILFYRSKNQASWQNIMKANGKDKSTPSLSFIPNFDAEYKVKINVFDSNPKNRICFLILKENNL